MSHYGVPSPKNPQTELEFYWSNFPAEEQNILYQQLRNQTPLTNEQILIFDEITSAVASIKPTDDARVFFLLASAGCGKTATAQQIVAYMRSCEVVTLVVASTAIAALNYPNDGTTAHSLFCVPVVEDFERDLHEDLLECNISEERLVSSSI